MSTSSLEAQITQLRDPQALAFLDAERQWLARARDKQLLPILGWSLAIARSGRGWGKTDVGANWVRRQAGLYPGVTTHIVAPSHADLTGTMINGRSGIIASTPPELIQSVNISAAIPTILFKNGSLIRGFSAQSPERLRGPQCTFLWGDELAAWAAGAKDTLTNIDMSTRIAYRASDGRLIQPQKLYTTTPKPLEWLAEMIERADINVIGNTMENRENLAEDFIKDLEQYKGTEIYRQEVLGELLDPAEAAIIKRSWIRVWPNARELPWFDFILISMDTAFTEKTFDKKEFKADPTACQVWGFFIFERRWNMVLLQHWKDHMGLPELIKRAKDELSHVYGSRTEQLYRPMYGIPMHANQVKRADLLLVEDKGSGISLRQMLQADGIDAFPYNPGKADKLSRLHGVSHVPCAGRVWVLESQRDGYEGMPRLWAEPMLKEVCTYAGPGTTAHDDDVDTFSMSVRYFADNYMNAGTEGLLASNSGGVEMPRVREDDDRQPGEVEEQLVENYYG